MSLRTLRRRICFEFQAQPYMRAPRNLDHFQMQKGNQGTRDNAIVKDLTRPFASAINIRHKQGRSMIIQPSTFKQRLWAEIEVGIEHKLKQFDWLA